jgi:hypothetical protein
VHIGFIASLLLHGVLLGWALLAVITTPPLDVPKPVPVEVSMVTEGDLVRLKQGDREVKNLDAEGKEGPAKEPPKKDPPKPTPPPPPQAAAPPPPPPLPTPEPPKPDPIAEAIKQAALEPPPPPKVEPPKVEPPKADPIADAIKQAEQEPPKPPKVEPPKPTPPPPPPKPVPKPPIRKPAAVPPPAPAKKDLAALVNDALKTAPEKSATNAPPKALIDRRATAANMAGIKSASNAKGPAAGAPEGTDTVLTADKLSMLGVLMKNNVQRCWNINSGLEGANKLIVKVEFKLNQAGQLIGEPKVTNTGAGPQFDDAANSARRALINCQPYTNLPPEMYPGGWDHMLMTFDPSKMFGG